MKVFRLDDFACLAMLPLRLLLQGLTAISVTVLDSISEGRKSMESKWGNWKV